MNDYNLIPLNLRSLEERRKIASMGGKKSGEERHRKSELRKALKRMLEDDDICDCVVISHVMKKRYCERCKHKQRANKERSSEKKMNFADHERQHDVR